MSTFGSRFLAEFKDFTADEVKKDIGVPRRRAAKVLKGIPWQFIPTQRCEGMAFIGLHRVLMLCSCLDVIYGDAEGAKPGHVTEREVLIAWTAAGYENWLKHVTLCQMQRQAIRNVTAENLDLVMGSIGARLGR